MLGKARRELTSVSGAADRASDALRYPIKVAFGIEHVPDQTPGATLTAGRNTSISESVIDWSGKIVYAYVILVVQYASVGLPELQKVTMSFVWQNVADRPQHIP